MTDGYHRDGEHDVTGHDIDRGVRGTEPEPETGAVDDGDGDGGADTVTSAGSVTDADAPAHRVDVDPAPNRTDADASDRRGGQLAGAHPEPIDRQFDWRGWILVGAIVVSFLVIPGIIVLYPHVGPSLGLTFWDTYLALPLIPAIVLAVLAVWATTRP